MRLYDAHNHLQDERLAPHLAEILRVIRDKAVSRMVVNGSCEQDWPAILELARCSTEVVPSFGYHPWYVKERTPNWQASLTRMLEEVPAGVGEIGLDRWIKDFDFDAQQEVFIWQLRLAAERNLPVSIHCLDAWGKLLEILRAEPRPVCGFVLHSFGGPQDMIEPLAGLGGYFSLPGYFAHERKVKRREAFRHVPPNRLLIETDAPDQLPPPECTEFFLNDPATGKPLNHPANLVAVYRFASELLGEPLETLVERVEDNFNRVFGGLIGRTTAGSAS